MVRDSRIILCHSELNTAFFIARFVVNRTSCRFILFIYKFVWLNKSACSITLTIIQQLKFLGQILNTEKDGPANIYTLHEPSHGRTTPERQQKPFSEPCSGIDRPRRTFLRGQHRAHLPKTEPVWDVDLQLAAPQSTHDDDDDYKPDWAPPSPIDYTDCTVSWRRNSLARKNYQDPGFIFWLFGFLMLLARLSYDINSTSSVTSTSTSTISRWR